MSRVIDLRSFLESYEAEYPSDVVRITRPIKAEFEVTAIAQQLEKMNKYPILIFEQVIDTRGRVSPFPCVINVLGDRRKLAFAIGSTFYDVALDWARRVEHSSTTPGVIRVKEAPSQENVVLGEEIDLLSLPALRHHEMDPGPYITAGMFTSYDPETWTPNMAFHRGFIAGPREIRCYLTSGSHNFLNLAAHERLGREMKVAYWIGHHPAVIMGAHVHMEYPADHYLRASALVGEPLRVVPSVTLGEDFLVPADAEFIIEGIIRPGRRGLEGPFGEFPRYYGPQQLSPVMEVTAVTYRNHALWHSFMVGINNNYSSVRVERDIFAAVKRAVPQVIRVAVPVSGCGQMHAYIQIKKTNDGQPKQAIMAALSASEYIKLAIVVDDDIDIYDDRWVLWAVATRTQMDRDLVVVPGCFGPPLDPSSSRTESGALCTKVGIDATKPAPPKRFPLRLNIPPEVGERVRLADYIQPEKLNSMPEATRP